MKLKQALARLLLLPIFLTAFPASPASLAAGQENQEAQETETGFRFRLSEGTPPAAAPTPEPTPSAPATRMSEAAANRLLARLPPIKAVAGDTMDFNLRPGSLPPPVIGQILEAAFATPAPGPPPVAADVTTPLRVLRFTPDGEVALAPALTITFSLPMVAVSSQEWAAAVVPVTLSPQPKGHWRWLGSQTLMFQPEIEGGRLPMATNYTVTIPA
jgi:hypothetical protein